MKPLASLAAAVFPQRCLLCERLIGKDALLCGDCEALRLRYPMRAPVCDVCGLRLKQCGCQPRICYSRAVFPFLYTPQTRPGVHRFKFRGRLDKAEGFAALMRAALSERGLEEQIDVICCVPMRPEAEHKRGYNQARELALALSRQTGIPCEELLMKIRRTGVQHKLGFLNRRGNLLGAFEPPGDAAKRIRGKRILVVDDILTSGATCSEAAKTLLVFGAQEVFCAVVAATPKKEKQEAKEPPTGGAAKAGG